MNFLLSSVAKAWTFFECQANTVTDEITQNEATNSPTQVGSSWWVWLAVIGRERDGGFVYGCAARSYQPVGWNDKAIFELPGGGRLSAYQFAISDENFSRLQTALSAGMLNTDSILEPAIRAPIKATRIIVQESFGQSAIETKLYYTLPRIQSLIGTEDGALQKLVSTLQEQLNLPFNGGYAGHLGNFEIFDLHPWLDAPPTFLVEFAPSQSLDLSGPQRMEICRLQEFAIVAHQAHVVGRVNGEVIINRLIKLPPGERRVLVDIQERLDQLDFSIFRADDGTLLHSEKQTFLNRIGLVMAPISRQMTIVDELSTRAEGKSKGLGLQASTVMVHSSQRSMIGAPADGSWRKHAEDAEQLVAAGLPKPGEDKRFPRGIEGEIGSIQYLSQLINAGHITHAVLVDAWFGADALKRFALRLGSQNLPLTILTSWTDIDPDSDTPLEPGEIGTAKLEAALRIAEPFLTPRLKVLNLVDGKDRAFHDRYLLLYPHEHPPKVFLLSNSINKLAGNWPFAMSLLAPDVSREVQRYIEALCGGWDSARNKPLTINYKWPADAS